MSTELPTTLRGQVRHYQGNGRKLGYPTANIDTPTTLDDGVYFGFADLNSYTHRPAIIFIGTPVTLGDKGRRVEAHLLDIKDVDYYTEQLSMKICHFHRSNRHFTSVDELMTAMKSDEVAARGWFEKQLA